jgi:putative N6-adenine-specific DNA methylase
LPGTIIFNPPDGERIGEEKDLKPLHRTLGEVLQKRCSGWTAFVFTGNASLAKCIDMKPAARISLFNGKIPCQLLRFDLK